jgi:hypothetical protein
MIERVRKLVRFAYLKELDIVKSWPQLANLIRDQGFPPGHKLGEKSRFWWDTEIDEWLDARPVPTVPPKQPPHSREKTGRGRGRPKKAASQQPAPQAEA